MRTDDWIYLLFLSVSIPFGLLVSYLPKGTPRKVIVATIGFSFNAFISGPQLLHTLTVLIGNCFIINFLKHTDYFHVVSLIWCFMYLTFFRIIHLTGLQNLPVTGHANAIQLFVTLRMIGIAFEIFDNKVLIKDLKDNPEDKTLKLKAKMCHINPTPFDLFCYNYCFVGLLSGPYFKYKTYYDMINSDKKVRRIVEMFYQLKLILPCTMIFLVTSNWYDIHDCEKPEWQDNSYIYKLLFMFPAFIVFRTRLYIAWCLGEIICIASKTGAYPKIAKSTPGNGPKDYEKLHEFNESEIKNSTDYDFLTIKSTDIYLVEFSPTVKEGMRGWNMTVQYWLASYIYKRISFGGYTFRTAVTMSVSAFWHGIHPGYYLSFLTIPPSLVAESIMIKRFKRENSRGFFDLLCWFFKMRMFEYMNMGFCLLSFESTINYWKSIHYSGHLLLIFIITFGSILGIFTKKKIA